MDHSLPRLYSGNYGPVPELAPALALFEDAEVVELGEFFHGRNGFADREAVQRQTAVKRRQ